MVLRPLSTYAMITVKNVKSKLKLLLRFEEGATAIEYAIMASAIAAVIVAVVGILGTKVLDLFLALVFPST